MNKKAIDEIKKRILEKKNNKERNSIKIGSSLKKIEEYKTLKKGESFLDGIYKFLRDNNLKASDLYTKAYVDRRVYSKMLNKDYKISKNTAICFCLAMELNLQETQEMLRRMGYALSSYDDFDIVISYCIENNIYDIIDVNEYLEELKLPLLGQKIQ